jgi:hypothetical protein
MQKEGLDSTPTDSSSFENDVESEAKLSEKNKKMGLVRYWCLEQVSIEKESKVQSLFGHTMVKSDPRILPDVP